MYPIDRQNPQLTGYGYHHRPRFPWQPFALFPFLSYALRPPYPYPYPYPYPPYPYYPPYSPYPPYYPYYRSNPAEEIYTEMEN